RSSAGTRILASAMMLFARSVMAVSRPTRTAFGVTSTSRRLSCSSPCGIGPRFLQRQPCERLRVHPLPDFVGVIFRHALARRVRLAPRLDHCEIFAEAEIIRFAWLDAGEEADADKLDEVPLPVAILDSAAV